MTKQEREITENLLKEYLDGKCSGYEIRQLYEILKSPENEIQVKDILMTHLDKFDDSQVESNNVNLEGICERILSDIRKMRKTGPDFNQTGRPYITKRLIIEIFSFEIGRAHV